MADVESSAAGPPGPPASLLAAIRRALRPLARLLIARGIPFPAFAELAKGIYVDVAEAEFPVEGKRQTDSRIHLLTGVHRKDVRRLRSEDSEEPRAPKRAVLASQVIARWTSQGAFLDRRKRPRALSRVDGGDAPSFDGLVRSVNTDIRPRVVLDELLRLGLVRLDDDDRVHLESDAFLPAEGSDELAFYFGRNLHDHFAAGVHNLLGETPRQLERSVNYNHLTPEAVAEIEALARKLGMEALQRINRRALALQQRSAGSPAAISRINFGIYFFSQEQPRRRRDDET